MKTSAEKESAYEKIKGLCYIRHTMPEIITREEEIQGEKWCLIFDDIQKKLYKLKGNALKIWKMLDGRVSVEMIVDQLSRETVQGRDVVVDDVCRFIAKVGKKGLIKAAADREGRRAAVVR